MIENTKLSNGIKKIYYILKEIRLVFLQVLYSPFLLKSIKKNKILIVSYKGHGYGDSGKRIVEYILEKCPKDEFEIYWAIKNDKEIVSFPSGVNSVKYGSPTFYYHMSTAKFWIDNSHKYEYPFKRDEQIYIQNWHGGLALKKIEGDANEKLSSYYIRNAKKDFKMVDLFTSNSNFQTDLIRRAFWYDGEIEKIGTPRVDFLIQKNRGQDLRKKLDLPKDMKIALYAPTFRNNHTTDVFLTDFKNIVKELDDYIFLVRHHPNSKGKVKWQDSDNVVDVTDYADMYELMKVSDILITDYSSTMFEFSFMKKPVFLYVTDYQEYIEERGFYFKLNELPYIITKDEDDLVQSIKNFNLAEYENDLERFLTEIDLYEKGHASEFVYKYIRKHMKN